MTIYLDNLAATPTDPRVVERLAAVASTLRANPNSVEHASGQRAHSILAEAHGSVGAFLDRAAEETTLTPGASVALWIAVQDAVDRCPARPVRVLASAIEHPALLKHLGEAGRQHRAAVTLFSVDGRGQPDLAALRGLAREGVDLVCMMAANNEVGSIAPIAAVLEIAREFGARTLVDASQAAGKVEIHDVLRADLVVASGAKLYGPRSAGVLAGHLTRRTRDMVNAMLGTPDVAAAAALALACELRRAEMAETEARVRALRDMLQTELLQSVPGLVLNGDPEARLPGALHVSAPDVPGDAVVSRLWGKVDVSTGAACQSGAPGPSHVLRAMKVSDTIAEGAVRIGVGMFNDEEEVRSAARLIGDAMRTGASRLRRNG